LASKEEDSVIQISAVRLNFGEEASKARNTLFVLDTCDKIDNCDVKSYETEKEMLQGWKKY